MFGLINFKGDSPDYAWPEVFQVSLGISFKLMFAGSFFKLSFKISKFFLNFVVCMCLEFHSYLFRFLFLNFVALVLFL